MRIWHFAAMGLLGLALAGCRTNPHTTLLERDNRLKEDEIYRLRGRVEELEDALQATGGSPPALRGVPAGEMPPEPGMEGTIINGGRPSLPSDRSRTEPRRLNGNGGTPRPSTFTPPKVEIPGTELPFGGKIDPLKAPAGDEAPPFVPSAKDKSSRWRPSGSPVVQAQALADTSRVAQITLHPSLTGGVNSGGQADEGMMVVIEPRDFSGNPVDAAGALSVALLDPALTGEQARLARWDFSAAEAGRMLRTGSQHGIHLKLPWSGGRPEHDQLKVFVRYTTSDGRKLQAEKAVSVALDGNPAERPRPPVEAETPRTAGRPQRPVWSPVR